MRLIERQMCNALKHRNRMRKDNTRVEWTRNDHDNQLYAEVFLHGHNIGTYYPVEKLLFVNDAGWQTPTTKSRLNALITEFVSPRSGIHQKDWDWYLTYDGATLKWTGDGVLTTN